MKASSEREFQNMVIGLARLCGWRVAHFRSGLNRRGQWSTPMQGDKGWPDLVLVRAQDGRLIFAELKTDTGLLSLEQASWLDALRKTKAEVFIWRPRDWDRIREILR